MAERFNVLPAPADPERRAAQAGKAEMSLFAAEKLFDISQLAEYFDVSRETVRRWVLDGTLPPPSVGQVGRRGIKRWRLEAVIEHLKRREATAAAALARRL